MPPKGEPKNEKKSTENAKGKQMNVEDEPEQVSFTERLLRRYRHWKLYSTWDFRRVWQCMCCLSAPKRKRRKYGIPAAEVEGDGEPDTVIDHVVESGVPITESENQAAIFKSLRKQNNDDDSSLRHKMDQLDQEQRDMLESYAASKIQSIVRLFLSKFIVREAWNDAVDEGTDYWDDYQEHSESAVMVKYRKRRAGIYVKNHFSRQYVSDVLKTGVLYTIQRQAAIDIQATWRGHRVRLKYLIYRKKHPRYKKVPVKSRLSDSSYRQVWARKIFEPLADGWPVKPSVLEYDMMEHKDKPPAGNDYGIRTYKVILAPRNEREKDVLLHDTNSWVGLPVYLQSSKEYKVDSDPHKNSLYKKSLSYRSAYTVPVVNLPPPKKPSPLKGDKALVAMGWNRPVKNKEKKNAVSANKKPQALYKLTIEQSDISTKTSPSRPVTSSSVYSNNLSRPSTTEIQAQIPELPSIFNESYKEEFQSYDETVMQIETEMAAKDDANTIREENTYDPGLSRSYLMAIRKEIAALNEQRFGYKGNVEQKIRVVTPLRGGQKYISSLHQKAFEYSRKYGAFALPPTLEDPNAPQEVEKFKDDFGVNLANSRVKELLFDKYRDYTSSQYGGLSAQDTVNGASKDSKISVLKLSKWGNIKSKIESTQINQLSIAPTDEGLQSRSLLRLRPVVEGYVRVWPIKKKKHYKLRYTWIPQKMVHKAVNIAYNDDEIDDSSFFTALDSGSVFTFSTKHTNNNILTKSLQDKSFDSYIDSVRYSKVAVEEKKAKIKMTGNDTVAEEEEKINKKSKPSASVQLNHPYPWV